jgi:hypothetical protein
VLLQVKANVKGFVVGSRYITPEDGPTEVEDRRAGDLVKAGLAEVVVSLRKGVAQAVAPKTGAERR